MNLYEKNNYCVTLDNCNFYSGNKCYDDCNSLTNSFYNYGNKECINECTGEYLYKDSDNTKKICYKRDQCNFLDTENNICYAECPNGSSQKNYHEYDSNICISNCASSSKNYLYHKENDKICYPSCSAIPGNYIYEIIDNTDHICKETPSGNECDYFVVKNNGIRRCLNKNACISNGYNFFIKINTKYECRESCEGYYKMRVVETSSGSGSLSFTYCYEDLVSVGEDTAVVVYYHIKSKRCWDSSTSPSFDFFIKSSSSTTSLKEIVEECENFYYESGELKYCIEKCKDVTLASGGYFFLNKNKKCESSCTPFSKYYYDPDNNECLDSCKGRINGFQNKISTAIQECLSSCATPNIYYSFDSNICIDGCGNDGSNNLYEKDGSHICYPSCLSIPGGDYIYEFSGKVCKNSNTGCGNYYLENGVVKCLGTSLEECKNKNYMYLIGQQCASSCDNIDDYKYEDNSALSGSIFIRCFNSPSDCLTHFTSSTIDKIYYSPKLKYCWTQMQSDLYINKIDSNKYELVEECDKFFYSDNYGYNNCHETCETGTGDGVKKFFVSGNKKCASSCEEFQKYYYSPDNNECLDTCKGRSNYGTQKGPTNPQTVQKCLANCVDNDGTTTNYYYNYDSNICMDYCGKDGSDKIYHVEDGYICYSSCSEIPGDYKYEKKTTVEGSSPSIYNYICSDNCNYYYLNSDGSKKCQDAIDCFNMNYIYLIENSNSQYICKNQCDDYYKLDITIPINSEDKQFIRCFQDYNDCYNYINQLEGTPTNDPIYYNEKAKRCWQTPPDYYYIIDNSDNSNKFKVVDKCDKYYYIDNNNYKHCTTACKTTDTPSLNLYFYNAGYYICCPGCQNNEFYDYDSKICIEKCGNGNSLYLYHTNIGDGNSQDQICYPSCKDIPNGNYVYESQDVI